MVVNCFQISIFAVQEQLISLNSNLFRVVNCFQISIFAVQEQHSDLKQTMHYGCELLSN